MPPRKISAVIKNANHAVILFLWIGQELSSPETGSRMENLNPTRI